MIFTEKLSDISDDPAQIAEWEAELIGTGTVPSSLTSYYRCISEHAVILLNEDGEPLWKGRSVRLATPDQYVALVTRDRGCVRCGASAGVCDAHHMIPSGAPAEGETNIDNLVLLCGDCHRWVHETNKTVTRNHKTGKWTYRPARWEEQTPKRGSPQNRKPSPDQRANPPHNTLFTNPND